VTSTIWLDLQRCQSARPVHFASRTMSHSIRRAWIRRSILSIVVCVTAAITCRDRGDHAERSLPTRDATVSLRAPSWDDRADRTPPPEGYIPAWQVKPPRPSADPVPAIPVPSPSAPSIDPVSAVDGARPPRPIPGLERISR
jgi:hypothetical protein